MENIFGKKNWVRFGLLWGAFMFLSLSIILPLLENASLDIARVMKSLVVWLIMGLAFGYTVHLFERRKSSDSIR